MQKALAFGFVLAGLLSNTAIGGATTVTTTVTAPDGTVTTTTTTTTTETSETASTDEPVELSDAQQAAARSVVTNVLEFALLHEMGHMMVGEFDLPVLGHSEDAADSFATTMLLVAQPDDTGNTLRDAMKSWFLIGTQELENDADDLSLFYDEHTLSISRGFEILCMMVGSNADGFAALATEYGMDEDRQSGCSFDFQLAANGWQNLLAPYSIDGGVKPADGGIDAASVGADEDTSTEMVDGPLTVSYEDDYEYSALGFDENLLASSNVLETMASMVNASFRMPRPINIVAQSCDGDANAAYDQDDAQIEVCYEFVDLIYGLVSTDILANPDSYPTTEADDLANVSLPIDLDVLAGFWTVMGVEVPDDDIQALVEDDPTYMDAQLTITADAITWTAAGRTGTLDPADDCESPIFDLGGSSYSVTCGSDPWGPPVTDMSMPANDTLIFTWYDEGKLHLTRNDDTP